MNDRNDETMKATLETDGRYEVREMHLFDTDAREEKALCRVDTSADELRGVDGYLDDRLYGFFGWYRSRGVQGSGGALRREPHPLLGSRAPTGRGG